MSSTSSYLGNEQQTTNIHGTRQNITNGNNTFTTSTTTRLSNPSYRRRDSAKLEFGSTVQFIFTMGLEGTGHHWLGALALNSPALDRLRRYQLWPREGLILQDSLFHEYNANRFDATSGLFNAHCAETMDSSTLQASIVSQLTSIEHHAQTMLQQDLEQRKQNQHPDSYTRYKVPFPVNSVPAGAKFSGEISYPNFLRDCRPLNFPDLNLFYDACQQAKVDCLQLYIYRHPVDILQSVMSRGYVRNTQDLATMQLYMTSLTVMANQLRMYADKTLGCFGFFETNPKEQDYWKEAQLDLWEWHRDIPRYRKFLQTAYRAPNNNSSKLYDGESSSMWWKNSEQSPYMKTWWNIHQHVIDVCKSAVKGNEKGAGSWG